MSIERYPPKRRIRAIEGVMSRRDVANLSQKGKAILDSAREMFEMHGYEGSSIREIVERAGCTKATMYTIFGDKLGLFYGVISSLASMLPPPSTVTMGSSWRIDLRFCAIAWRVARLECRAECYALNKLLTMPMGKTSVDPLKIWREVFDPYQAAVSEAIADAKKRGYLRVDRPDLAASQFMCLVRGRPHREPGGKEIKPWLDGDLKKHIDSTTAFFLAAHAVRDGQWDHLLYP
ncbi:TetR/AcrR family transcriptional regulator [Stenotrophomonas sp. S39]|uniref:TetR/AcrR family transcriptional regulator n=1 Tax=Stenotrophomonas sp. S39 TaxID=2767451 RepID=UPI0019095091|nr:TetR/AcrR family transcriptional regulator [Stenotrophomonas sp. S39]MBK0052723.1 TetR/AcrR family transcriptional regulator [Stenotrophomonas sp. S39]